MQSRPRHYLREWLDAKGISQRKIALEDDHKPNTINRYCSNPHYRIETSIAIRLAKYLGISVEELYREPPEE